MARRHRPSEISRKVFNRQGGERESGLDKAGTGGSKNQIRWHPRRIAGGESGLLGRLTKMENTNQSSSVRAEEPEFFAAKNVRESMVGGDRRLARMIDQTNLRPEATEEQIIRLCREAREFDFAAVVVNAAYVELASTELAGSEVKVASVVGFPLGATLSSVKRFEAGEALKLGAREIDMVLNLGALKSGKRELVQADIRSVAEVTHERGGLLKVILETVLLTEDEKQLACELSVKAGADFVKTSTGFLGGGATVGDVQLMRRIVGPSIGVKASGGIRTAADAKAMIEAGANRIGTSSGVKIIEELREPLQTTR